MVTRQEIETMHMQNVEEALRTVPGVQFLSYGATNINANLNGVRINGSKDIVVLVDGVRVNAFQDVGNSGYMFANLLKNMNNVERIEVLRGAAATVYGSGAKGGVINIITRKADKTETTLDASAGAFGRRDYNLNTMGKVNKLSYNAYYGYSKQGNVKDPTGYTWYGDSKTRTVGTSLSYAFNDKSNLSFMYNHSKTKYDALEPFYYDGTYYKDSKYETTDITLRHDYKFSDLWSNSLTYRRSKVDQELNYLDSWDHVSIHPYTNYPMKNIYHFWSDQVTYNSDKHTLVMGFDYAKASMTRTNWKRLPITTRMSNWSTYIQDDWKILPRVTLSGGLRYDKPDQQGDFKFESHTSKSYKISYDVTDKDTIYAGRSDFYILPSIAQLTNPQYGNPALKPSEGRTTSIGYTKKFSDRNSLMLSWFETKSTNAIGISWNGQFYNAANDVARGWNAQWSSQLDQHWTFNLGWSHLYQKLGPGQAYPAEGDNFFNGYQPKDLATISLYYYGGKWTGGLDGFYFIRRMDGASANPYGWPSNKYGVFNLSANYQASKDVTVYAKVENIFNKLWAEQTASLGTNPGQDLGHYYTQPRRNLTLGVQYKF